jgi:type IV secretory pathway TrbL component
VASENKIPIGVIVLGAALLLWVLVNRSITTAANKVSGPGATNLGYGIGSGAVAQGASSLGSFLGGLFSSGSNTKPGYSTGGNPINAGGTSSAFSHDLVYDDRTYDDRILDSQSDSVAFTDNDV